MSSTTTTPRVGIIGAGQMGSGIAEVCARAHAEVLVWESNEDLLEAGRKRLHGSLDKGVSRGKLTAGERDQAVESLRFTTDLADFADREVVIEAVIENEEIKTSILSKLDKILEDPKAILASNTSSIPLTRLAAATTHPERVVGLHFFNPVPVLPLVELITTVLTDDEVARRAREFAETTLKKQVVATSDRSGFVVNALLVPYLISAIRMVEGGFATARDVDQAMMLGAAHPMGPLALSDMIGLDTIKAVADSMYEEYKEPFYAAPPLLQRMVEAGMIGRKSGRGFHDYSA